MSLKALAERILQGNRQGNRTETESFLPRKPEGNFESFLVSLPRGGNQETDTAEPWRPTPRAWLQGEDLHVTGVVPLAAEIIRLTADDPELQARLLKEHCLTLH